MLFVSSAKMLKRATTSCKSTWDTVPYFGLNGLSMILCLWTPLHPKVASNTRPYSKLGGTTLNGREEGGQYYILQTCDLGRFEARKVVFPWECLIIFATGCSLKRMSEKACGCEVDNIWMCVDINFRRPICTVSFFDTALTRKTSS